MQGQGGGVVNKVQVQEQMRACTGSRDRSRCGHMHGRGHILRFQSLVEASVCSCVLVVWGGQEVRPLQRD